jgi:hypothetical protein
MPLTGLSLEMYIFHFEAISMSTHIFGSKRPISTYLGSLERPWPVDGFVFIFCPKMGLWPAPDSITIPKIPNFGHDWALSIGNFVLLIISRIRSYLEKKLAALMACARFQGQFIFFIHKQLPHFYLK